MKPGDVVQIIDVSDPWLGSTGVVLSYVETDGKPTDYVRVTEISDHSLPHAVGIWSVSSLKQVKAGSDGHL